MTVCRTREQAQPLFTQALKTIGRSPRLESSPSQYRCSPLLDNFGDCLDLVFALYTTGASHHDDLISSNFQAETSLRQNDPSPFRLELTASKLIGCANTDDFTHALQQFDFTSIDALAPDNT